MGCSMGELVAFNQQGLPHFPLVCRRLLHGDRMVPLVFVGFDVLQLDGGDTMGLAYHASRKRPVSGPAAPHPFTL